MFFSRVQAASEPASPPRAACNKPPSACLPACLPRSLAPQVENKRSCIELIASRLMRLQQDQREAMSSLAEAAGREKALKARRSALSPHPRVATWMRWNQRAVAWVLPSSSPPDPPPIPPRHRYGVHIRFTPGLRVRTSS